MPRQQSRGTTFTTCQSPITKIGSYDKGEEKKDGALRSQRAGHTPASISEEEQTTSIILTGMRQESITNLDLCSRCGTHSQRSSPTTKLFHETKLTRDHDKRNSALAAVPAQRDRRPPQEYFMRQNSPETKCRRLQEQSRSPKQDAEAGHLEVHLHALSLQPGQSGP